MTGHGAGRVFRFRFTLEEKGGADRLLARVEIDDTSNARRVRDESMLPHPVTEGLFDVLDAHVIPAMGGASTASATNGDLSVVTLTCDGQSYGSFAGELAKYTPFHEFEHAVYASGCMGYISIHRLPDSRLISWANQAYSNAVVLLAHEPAPSNLWRAAKCLDEATWYLESIGRKPEFYSDLLSRRATARGHLESHGQQLCAVHMPMALAAMSNRNWAVAADHLWAVMDGIPDPADKRRRQAASLLLEAYAAQRGQEAAQ